MKNVIVGTAGHIDHGKSALVEALTGTHPDRLEEEKRRGITIDLGFAFLDLGEIHLGLVDVPGHERFVRNMLAGVGGIDLVLLVIAADESVKPQTREHFDICRLLGIPRGLVALTKSDLVEPDVLDLVRLETEDFLRGSFLEGAPIVPVSARTGAGIDQLRDDLRHVAGHVPHRDTARHFRLPIDRAFAMKGFGTVVTGTLISGTVKREDEVELFPSRRRIRVRGVQSGGRTVEFAESGQRTAVNLAGIDLEDARRGMVLASPGCFEPTRRVDAHIELLGSARRLKNHARVHFHQGTAETVADVVFLEQGELHPGGTALAQLRLGDSVLVLPGDRFILRQFSPVVTIGGGIVLDPLAPRHRAKRAQETNVLAYLSAVERGNLDEILDALAEGVPQGFRLDAVVARTGWMAEEVGSTAERLAKAGKLCLVSEHPRVMVSSSSLAACVARLKQALDDFHGANSLVEGIPKEELRARAAGGVLPEVFRAALDELVRAGGASVNGDTVKRAGREVSLQPDEAQAKAHMEQAFAHAGLAVPSLKTVLARLPVEPARARKLLQLLLRERILLKITDDLVFHSAAIAQLRKELADYKARQGERMPIAAFKELTGISRKYAIPLLEYLDRERVTRRVGDERVIL